MSLHQGLSNGVGTFVDTSLWPIVFLSGVSVAVIYFTIQLLQMNLGLLDFVIFPGSLLIIGFLFYIIYEMITDFDNKELMIGYGIIYSYYITPELYGLGLFGDEKVGLIILYVIIYFLSAYLFYYICKIELAVLIIKLLIMFKFAFLYWRILVDFSYESGLLLWFGQL
ncbi:hypothetical protein [Photobacterium marinum]|uniref:hypothetical protein n=1 Tax=Photobacterium marinum TaxID=1056511 RepID=UPI00055FC135|nr:hypothetical protein [Photobacterium marinum]